MQAESIDQREVLLREMEKATARTARETVARRDEKTSRAEELQIQVGNACIIPTLRFITGVMWGGLSLDKNLERCEFQVFAVKCNVGRGEETKG